MGVRKSRPTTPGRRAMSHSTFDEVTRSEPEKRLTRPNPRKAGRNGHGRITARHQGGGHKQKYRIIDFRRDKDGIPARVAEIEYDPNRNARIALLNYVDGEKRYILAPAKVGVGEMLMSGPDAEIRTGNAMALSRIPLGSTVHNIELKPGGGGKMVRAAGTSAQLVAREGKVATLRMPSSEVRQVSVDCRATIGEVGNAEFELVQIGKAGRARWKNHRPSVRGVAMNPVDHPLGGGEGKASGGRHPVTPWGKPEGRTRKKGKYSDHDIVRRRGSKRR